MNWQDSLSRDYSLDSRQLSSLETLLQLLLDRSDRNLTAVTSPENIINVHFRDSLALLDLAEVSRASTAVDIGSGAGFPGLPLAIAKPQLYVTLLEANQGKCAFIQETLDRVGLENARVLGVRAEDAARTELRDYFDIAFARAVGPLPVTLEYSLPLIKPGGFAVLQRGELHDHDKATASAVSRQLASSLDRVITVKPFPEAKNLHVWLIHKDGKTPERFPRKPGLAKKRPLK